jgi:hypothetical protein
MNFFQKIISSSLFMVLITNFSGAQLNTTQSDSLALKLVERHKLLNASKLSVSGYRVQIYFGTDRNKAQEVRSEFLSNNPNTPAYLIYHQPYFKVRIGDFYSRLDAIGFLNKIAVDYTTSFVVSDDVKLPVFE